MWPFYDITSSDDDEHNLGAISSSCLHMALGCRTFFLHLIMSRFFMTLSSFHFEP